MRGYSCWVIINKVYNSGNSVALNAPDLLPVSFSGSGAFFMPKILGCGYPSLGGIVYLAFGAALRCAGVSEMVYVAAGHVIRGL